MTEQDDSKWRVPPDDPQREQWLVDLGDKTAVDSTALAGNPFERKADWRSTFRATGSRAWAAAALAVAVLVLAWNLRPATTVDIAATASPDGTIHLTAPDPSALEHQLVADLHAAGIEANGYEQLNTIGVDADLPRPLTPDVRRVLEKYRIIPPVDGVLRIEVSKSANGP
jgi:hypothetical protein